LALHYEARFLRNPSAADRARQGFQHILTRYAGTGTSPLPAPAKVVKSRKLAAEPKARREPAND
jgi:hypothetical protein